MAKLAKDDTTFRCHAHGFWDMDMSQVDVDDGDDEFIQNMINNSKTNDDNRVNKNDDDADQNDDSEDIDIVIFSIFFFYVY